MAAIDGFAGGWGVKIAILGNGILAASIALRLAPKLATGDRLMVVGRKERPGSATLAAAAMLNSFAEVDHGSLGRPIEAFRFELSRTATVMWPDFIRQAMEMAGSHLPAACAGCQGPCGGCFDRGTFVVNNNAADDLDDLNFDAILSALREHSEPHELVDPRDIPNYQPEQRFRASRAVFIPNEGWVNPRLLMLALDAALARTGRVDFVDDEVESMRASAGRVASAVLSSGAAVEADTFLLATGATSTDLLQRSGFDLKVPRVFYGVGVSIELYVPEFPHTKCVRTPNRGLACGLYTVPYYRNPQSRNDTVLIGASNFISPVPHEHGRAVSVQSLLKGAMEQINTNFYRAEVARVNVGWRPTSADTYPMLGGTSMPNLFIATGTKRDGLHLAPLVSEVLAAQMLGQSEGLDERMAWFRPERPLIRSLTRDEAVQQGTRHLVSAAYQHGFTPPHGRMVDAFVRSQADELEALHDRVGAVTWGIPPEMIDMYRYGHVLD